MSFNLTLLNSHYKNVCLTWLGPKFQFLALHDLLNAARWVALVALSTTGEIKQKPNKNNDQNKIKQEQNQNNK